MPVCPVSWRSLPVTCPAPFLRPSGARVSGVVEKSPGPLEYEVGLYRERSLNSGQFSVPVEEPVPIGTRLQLITSISTDAGETSAQTPVRQRGGIGGTDI